MILYKVLRSYPPLPVLVRAMHKENNLEICYSQSLFTLTNNCGERTAMSSTQRFSDGSCKSIQGAKLVFFFSRLDWILGYALGKTFDGRKYGHYH